MWEIGSWFPTGDGWDRDICFYSFLQISDKADNDIYPRPTRIILLRISFAAPSVHHLLGKTAGIRVFFQAISVEKEQVCLVRGDIPMV